MFNHGPPIRFPYRLSAFLILFFLLLEMGEPKLPKTIDFTIDYLREHAPEARSARRDAPEPGPARGHQGGR